MRTTCAGVWKLHEEAIRVHFVEDMGWRTYTVGISSPAIGEKANALCRVLNYIQMKSQRSTKKI
jgi:hypothetical protein